MQPQRRRLGLAPWQWTALLAVCLTVFILTLSPWGAGEAHAYTIDPSTNELIINASAVDVQLDSVEASYNNHFGITEPRSPEHYIFYCKTAEYDEPYDLGTFSAGELEFKLTTPDTRRYQRQSHLLYRARQPEPRQRPARSHHHC